MRIFLHALIAFAVMSILLVRTPAEAQEVLTPSPDINEEVDIELILAVDISGSVDSMEARTQREGYIAALTHPSVIGAIQSAFHGKIAMSYVEWAGTYSQNQLIDWTMISDEASAHAFASILISVPLNQSHGTSISHAIDFCVDLFDDNGYAGIRRVIDISGDGTNRNGRPVTDARNAAIARGITINGLPIILDDRPEPRGRFGMRRELHLDQYYNDNVIGGPGAFLVVAEDYQAFRGAILSKLIREIAQVPALKDQSLAIAQNLLN